MVDHSQHRPFRQASTIRFRVPTEDGALLPGHIVMGDGPRTRRAYRVFSARTSRGGAATLGCVTWILSVEFLSAEAGRSEVKSGCRLWGIEWDSRKPKVQRL